MSSLMNGFVPVIGLEVHVQLKTNSKIFSDDLNSFKGSPNVNLGPITIAHPGTLPVLNREVVNLALKLGLALDCQITRQLIFDRKNYFYPDLPKGYQITQDSTPICIGGGLKVEVDGNESFISLTKIHMEEDAGKSIHVENEDFTYLDLNRAGVPLLEIVTDPVIKTADEAAAFLTEIRKIVRFLEISDGNMEEGSLRCDANVSIHKPDSPLGNKVEIKNMNSFKSVKKAINHEIARQSKLIGDHSTVLSETRTFDVNTGISKSMRDKEILNDYRYFPEPDLSPVSISKDWLQQVKKKMPELPSALKKRLISEFSLSEYEAEFVSNEREVADYFNNAATSCDDYGSIVNFIMGPLKSLVNDTGGSFNELTITPSMLGDIIEAINSKEINYTQAVQKVIPYIFENSDLEIADVIRNLDLSLNSTSNELESLINEVLDGFPEKVKAYHNGKKGVSGLFMGEVMKKSGGKLDPRKANLLIAELLENRK